MVFGFGRKAKFEKELHELKALVVSQSILFAGGVTEEAEGLAAFSALPRTYDRCFSSVAPPKSDTTLFNQINLFLGAFGFFWHAIDRYSFRKDNEALRAAIVDPIVTAVSKLVAEWCSNMGAKTTADEVLQAVQPVTLRYAVAQTLLGTDPNDTNSAVWMAGPAIVNDTELPLTAAQKLILVLIVKNNLAEGLLKLELPKRIETLETLL
jgi:hypothetical protein